MILKDIKVVIKYYETDSITLLLRLNIGIEYHAS